MNDVDVLKDLLQRVIADGTGDLDNPEKRIWPIRAQLYRDIVNTLEMVEMKESLKDALPEAVAVLKNSQESTDDRKAKEAEALSSYDRVTLSGKPPVEGYKGPAPAPVDTNTGMHQDYWVLPEAERAKGFIRPYRDSYKHTSCGHTTTMGRAIAETYARNYRYYGKTFCANCGSHYPIGEHGEFVWLDGSKVGT